jgi:hypothetical protein
MIVFRILLYGATVAIIFFALWFLIGRFIVRRLHPEDKPEPNTIDKMKARVVELEMRKAELYAKKKALETAQKRLGVAKEAIAITEEIAQTEMRLKKTEDRLEGLDRVMNQQLHTS